MDRAGLAGKRLLKFRGVGEGTDDAELRHRVRIALDQLPLRLDAHGVSAGLTPGNKELLLRRETIHAGHGVGAHGLLQRRIGDAHAAEIGNGFVAQALAIVVDPGFDEIPFELIDQALAARLEVPVIFLAPPIMGMQPDIHRRSRGIDCMREVVRHGNSHGAIVHRIGGIRIEERRLQCARRQYHGIDFENDVTVGR